MSDNASGHMSEYEYGKMDITEQEKTYAGFLRVIGIVFTACIVVLLFMLIVNG